MTLKARSEVTEREVTLMTEAMVEKCSVILGRSLTSDEEQIVGVVVVDSMLVGSGEFSLDLFVDTADGASSPLPIDDTP